MACDPRVRLVFRLERRWLMLMSQGDREAVGLGLVIDALEVNRPDEALLRCAEAGLSDEISRDIRKIFRDGLDGLDGG